MCVALPGIVKKLDGNRAVVDFNGNQIEARAGLIDVTEGDRVLVHAGMILQKVSSSEAEEMERLFEEIGQVSAL